MDVRTLCDRLFWLCCLGIVMLFAFPPQGFWTETLPGSSRWFSPLALAIPLALFPPGRAEERARTLEATLARWIRPLAVFQRSPAARMLAACSIFALIAEALFLSRSQFVHGDSANVVQFVEQGDWFHKRAPLSIAAMQTLHSTLGTVWGWTAEQSVQRASAFAGAAAVFAVGHFARTVGGTHRLLQLGVAAAVLSSAASLLFFGYIEHYGLSSAAALWCLALGARALARGTSPRPAALCATLAALIHGAMATLAVPVAFLIGWSASPGRPGPARWGEAARTVGLCALLVAAVIGLMRTVGYRLAHETGFGGSDQRMFVPWSEIGGYSRYTLLSLEHIRAVLNQWLLVLPGALPGLPLFAFAAFSQARSGDATNPRTAALVYSVLCGTAYLALTSFWNPDLGPLGDWDLFAPPGLLASAAAAALITAVNPDRPGAAARALALITGINLSRAIPWIAVNCFAA